MKYIVQSNLLSQEDYKDTIAAMDELNLEYYPIKVRPFDRNYIEGVPELKDTDKVVILGSTTLMSVCEKRKWFPGMWTNDNFNYVKYLQNYGGHMLNDNAIICKLREASKFQGVKFIRPVRDAKQFAGEVIGEDEFEQWQQTLLTYQTSVSADTKIVIADVKDIIAEWRFFVVDGKVVTGSMYRKNNQLFKYRVDTNDEYFSEAIEFAQSMVNKWQPDRVFVIDIALAEGNYIPVYKIVELNTMNCAGFYQSDIKKILKAIEGMGY